MSQNPVSPIRSDPMIPEPDPRYPIGRFQPPLEAASAVSSAISPDDRLLAIATLAELPSELRNVVRGLDGAQLDTPYRQGGWTVRQVVHHLADSHMNAFIRVKCALTEEWPTVKAYDEVACAKLHDSTGPVEWSLELIESLHARWVMLLQSLQTPQWKRGFIHSENGREAIDLVTLQYAWHSRHHLAHIQHLRQREGW